MSVFPSMSCSSGCSLAENICIRSDICCCRWVFRDPSWACVGLPACKFDKHVWSTWFNQPHLSSVALSTATQIQYYLINQFLEHGFCNAEIMQLLCWTHSVFLNLVQYLLFWSGIVFLIQGYKVSGVILIDISYAVTQKLVIMWPVQLFLLNFCRKRMKRWIPSIWILVT